MNTKSFKQGDWVVRINGDHQGMHIGDVTRISDTNVAMESGGDITLEGYGGTHSQDNLRLAEAHEIPEEFRSKIINTYEIY